MRQRIADRHTEGTQAEALQQRLRLMPRTGQGIAEVPVEEAHARIDDDVRTTGEAHDDSGSGAANSPGWAFASVARSVRESIARCLSSFCTTAISNTSSHPLLETYEQ